jgi:hypothetical protein
MINSSTGTKARHEELASAELLNEFARIQMEVTSPLRPNRSHSCTTTILLLASFASITRCASLISSNFMMRVGFARSFPSATSRAMS